MPLSAADIAAAFDALSDELVREGAHAELVVMGGAAMVLLFGARDSTKDVDAYFVRPEASLIRSAVTRAAARLDLPPDWLNDAAKRYVIALSEGDVLYESAALMVRAASTAQLLAMKLAAWRDAIDRSDAALLLRQMDGTADQIWTEIRPFIPPARIDKASYAFEDLWESLYGHS